MLDPLAVERVEPDGKDENDADDDVLEGVSTPIRPCRTAATA
jgi:hypothetical protein